MNQFPIIPDELLDRLGEYYNSEFVQKHMPWIRERPFLEWAEKEIRYRFPNFKIGAA